MKRFVRVLKEIDRKLDLPEQERSRILLEIGSDLEDMYELYREEGLGEREAMQRAEEMFDISDEALEELARIHRSIFEQLLNRLSEQAQSRWEKVMLVITLLLIAVFSGRQVFSSDFFLKAGIFVWPILGIAFLSGSFAIRHAYIIYIRKARRPGRLREGLMRFIVLSTGSLLVGICGLSVETMRTMRAAAADIDTAYLKIIRCATTGSSLMITSLLVAIASSMIWFFFASKANRTEQAATEWLKEK